MTPRRIQILEVGAGRLACAIFTANSGRLVLKYWDHEAVDPEWTTNLQQFEHLRPKLATFVARQPRHACTLMLPGHLVLTKIVSITASTIDGGMRLDPAEHIPIALSEVIWGWQELDRDDALRTVLIAAARRAQVERLCELVRQAGLTLERVVPAAAGMLAALTLDDAAGAIVSIDVRSTLLAAASGTRCLVRTIPFGHRQAESEPNRLEQEIERTLVHWTQAFGFCAPSVLRLAGGDLGGGPGVRGSRRVERYDATVERELPHGAGTPAEEVRPEMLGVAGAVLRQRQVLIDLSPDALAKERTNRKRVRAGIATASLTAIALLPPLWFHRAQAAETARRAQSVERELGVVTSLQSANTARWREIELLQARVLALRPAYAARDSWARFLSELQEGVADVGGAWIDRLQVVGANGRPAGSEGRRLLVGGRLSAVDALPASARARQLLDRLARSTFVAALEGERFEYDGDGSLRFAVTLVLNPGSLL